MKCVLVFLVGIFLLGTALSFATRPESEGRPGAGYAAFAQRAAALSAAADAYRAGAAGRSDLREAVAEARRAYKRVAWLTEYYYPAYTGKHFNGAPLLKAEKYGTHSTVEPPEGLQVLDEAVYAAEVDAAQVAILARTLSNHVTALAPEMAERPYPLDELLEAMRTELVRIPTLYLTGFDTPGSLAGLAEARVALNALHDVLQQQEALAKHAVYREVIDGLGRAARHLEENPDFDTFDRLAFQRDHLNGLYRRLASLQAAAGLPPTVRFPSGRDPRGTELFADGFLNPYTYTELDPEDDTPALRRLGETLFFDSTLSRTGTLSCASCHRPEQAFTDGAGRTARNTPTLVNAVYADRYFYDLRAFSLEQQAEHVIYDHGEFDTGYDTIVAKLRASDHYRERFAEAFGRRATIDRASFSAALASYVLSLRSFNSPFDRYARGETDALDARAREGYNLFMGKAGCGTCHFAPTFSGLVPPGYTENESEILGVVANPHAWTKTLDPDRGRAAGSTPHEDVWIYDRSFKTPTVRNVALTAPYFHNGAYATLESVMEFYDRGGGGGLGLAVTNQTLPREALALSKAEKAAVIAFMEALTDADEGADSIVKGR